MLDAYKRYPFKVPLRTKFINVFRYFFTFRLPEKYLLKQLSRNGSGWWRKVMPPLYLYRPGSTREVMREGIRYTVDISRLIDHSIYFYNFQEVAWSNLFTVLKDNSYIIDAGANIGHLSLQLAKRCPNGMVYSFEPDPDNFNDLHRNVQHNSFQNIKLFRKALGAREGVATLYKIYRMNPGTNRILSQQPEGEFRSETVDVTTLDELDKQGIFKRVDFIKIDVEGFEGFVLQGAAGVIQKWRPVLFIELVDVNLKQQHWSSLSLAEYVERLGYTVLDAKYMQPLDKTNITYTDILCFPTTPAA